jgi:hypothetical protein
MKIPTKAQYSPRIFHHCSRRFKSGVTLSEGGLGSTAVVFGCTTMQTSSPSSIFEDHVTRSRRREVKFKLFRILTRIDFSPHLPRFLNMWLTHAKHGPKVDQSPLLVAAEGAAANQRGSSPRGLDDTEPWPRREGEFQSFLKHYLEDHDDHHE